MKIRISEPEKARIEMVPIIDSVFLILAFFLCAFLSMSIRQSVPMNLPESKTSVVSQEKGIAVGISADGTLFFEKEPMELSVLKKKFQALQGQNPVIYLYADRNALHGRVMQVLDLLRLYGLQQVLIETQPADSNESS